MHDEIILRHTISRDHYQNLSTPKAVHVQVRLVIRRSISSDVAFAILSRLETRPMILAFNRL
jgi:hypothetical protein